MSEEQKISDIKFEEQFIKSLLEKLKVGNRRGIHLNAIPGNARSRLDLKEIDSIKEGKANDFLNTLLSEDQFSYTIDFEGINLTELDEEEKNKLHLIARRLNNVSIDNEDQFLESGIKNFGFGYPLLIRRDSSDPSKVIKAPLLIWNLDIVRSNRKNNSWTISRTPDHPIRVNELLRSHVLRDTQISIDALDEEALGDNIIDKTELVDICKNILSQINSQTGESDVFDIRIEKCPTSKKIDSLATDNAWIQWSGIFGIYTSRKESIIQRAQEMLERLKEFKDEKLVLDKFQTSTVSAVSTDPSKEEIINTLTENEVKLIQGPPGTGKSQALTAIITNTIQSGGKCLVVCEKKTALNIIYHNLEKIGLSDLSVIVDDVSRDRSAVVKKARNNVDATQFVRRSNGLETFNRKYSEFIELRDSFNQKHYNERKSKISEDSWKDAVGRFIQYSKQIDWERIKGLMPEFEQFLSEEKYLELETRIQDASIAFGALDQEALELYENISNDHFSQKFSRRVSDELKDRLVVCNSLFNDLFGFISKFSKVDYLYKDVDIFDIDQLKKNLLDETNKHKLFSIYQKGLESLSERLKKFKPVEHKSGIITDQITTEQINLLQLDTLGLELESLIGISKENIEVCNFFIDNRSTLIGEASNTDGLIDIHKSSEIKDSINQVYHLAPVEEFLKSENKRLKILESLYSEINTIKSFSDEKVIKTSFLNKIKGLFSGSQSVYRRKAKVRKIVTDNLEILKEARSFSGFNNEEISKLLNTVESIIKELGTSIGSLEKIHSNYDTITSLENKIADQYDKTFADQYQALSKFQKFDEYLKEAENRKSFINGCLGKYPEYEKVHNWINYRISLQGKEKEIITNLVNEKIDAEEWLTALRAWRYYYLLLNLEENSTGFHKTDDDLKRLSDLYFELEKGQRQIILHNWQSNLSSKAPSNFKLLYNLRRNNVHNRTNSLRKIINQDFDLFTSVFPVILTNPLAADAMLPLKLGIFDVVIFDEASQLRIEDTFTSFIRGKYKIVAGDIHQMPPSNYFQAVGDVSQDDDLSDDEIDDTELALSESLIDFAEKLGFQSQSYLDYHYRSQHPALIDFSNIAFYGGNLVPFPEKFAYNPIEFYQVDGVYSERTNEKEVNKVMEILKNEITQKEDSTYPSVGIATFNIPQRNRIIDAVNEAVIMDKDFAKKMDKIRASENGFFIKNLENIQGDEMDIIIISTTYGKDNDGRFFERFGPLNLEKGYKLLNVIVTRAKEKIYVCTSVPKNKYLSYNDLLQEYGNNKRAIFYAYLAYANFLSSNKIKQVNQLKEDLIGYSHDRPRNKQAQVGLVESPFEQEVYECLLESFSEKQITPQEQIGGFRVDFLIKLDNKKVIIECDGKSYHSTNEAYAHDLFRQKELENLGYIVYRIWSTNWWHDHNLEINKLLKFLEGLMITSKK